MTTTIKTRVIFVGGLTRGEFNGGHWGSEYFRFLGLPPNIEIFYSLCPNIGGLPPQYLDIGGHAPQSGFLKFAPGADPSWGGVSIYQGGGQTLEKRFFFRAPKVPRNFVENFFEI